MSLDLTFRQKLIRIACSAAVCGLSFSFMIGEVVDREAKQLRSWTVDPALLPIQYLPTRPVIAVIERFETPTWREQLVAINSLPSLPVTTPSRLEDSLKIAIAAPAKAVAPPYIEESKPVPVSKNTTAIAERELRNTEVEVILASIHSATAKLSAPPATTMMAVETGPEVSKSQALKASRAPAPTQARRSTPVEQLSQPSPPPQMTASAAGTWALNGRILSSTAHSNENGHYEVGLFSKIDPDGKPVGFPLPQQILPEGQTTFRLDVPARIEKGYLFAEFVAAKTGRRSLIMPAVNPWVRTNKNQIAELYFRAEDTISSIAAASSVREAPKENWKVHGSVTTMFAVGGARLAQNDVVIKVRGRKEATRTDQSGNFSMELPRLKGTLFLEVLKAGFHPSIVSVSAGDDRALQIEIASRHAIDQISQRLGATQGSTKGIFVGRFLGADGNGMRGLSATLSLKSDGPFYFDDEGIATREAKASSGNGRFLFLNVESGTGYLESTLNSEPVAPLQVSMVDGGELTQKSLMPTSGSLRGRIFNPVSGPGKMAPIAGARVRIDGASEWVTSDSFGAFSIGPLKWFKGERITLEVSAEKFNNHRYLVSADQAGAVLNLFAFPASYVGKLARSMDVDLDPYSGLIIGKVSGAGVRMDALADHSTVNNAKDFYFDPRGRLRGSHEMTDPKFGTYIIFNVPKGRTILQGNDGSGLLRYSDSVFASPASINVQMD